MKFQLPKPTTLILSVAFLFLGFYGLRHLYYILYPDLSIITRAFGNGEAAQTVLKCYSDPVEIIKRSPSIAYFGLYYLIFLVAGVGVFFKRAWAWWLGMAVSCFAFVFSVFFFLQSIQMSAIGTLASLNLPKYFDNGFLLGFLGVYGLLVLSDDKTRDEFGIKYRKDYAFYIALIAGIILYLLNLIDMFKMAGGC